MKFRISLLLFGSLFIAATLSAQGFLRSYNPVSSSVRDLVQTADGGYFLAGEVSADSVLFLLRTDAAGSSIWANHLALNGANAIAVCAANDGGFVLLLENYSGTSDADNAVLKLAADGTTEWLKVIENSFLVNGLRDILTLPDGHFIAVGNTYIFPQGARNTAVKIAPDGTIVWQKNMGTQFRQIRRAVLLSDGAIAVSGHGDDFYVVKINTDGFLVWERTYNITGVQTNYDLLATTDANIALLGTTQGNAPGSGASVLKIIILKTDLDGNLLWHKDHYPFPSLQVGAVPFIPVFNSFTQDADGNFYVPFWGFQDDPLMAPLEILKTDPAGDALLKANLNIAANAWQVIRTQDAHLAIAGDNNGFPTKALLLKTDRQGEYLNNVISGNVFRDADLDCEFTAGEIGLSNFIIKAVNQSGEVFYQNIEPDGTYQIRVTEGDFSLTTRPVLGVPAAYHVCDTHLVSLIGTGQIANAPPLGVQVLAECPLLEVGISSGLIRRCMATNYQVNWCNSGNLTAENVYVELTADALLSYQNSTVPLSSQNGTIYRFDLPSLPPGECGHFSVTFQVSCDAEINQSICVDAHIYPDSACLPPNGSWDGAIIEVTGTCTGAEIEFNIKNVGAGNMAESAEYVIIEDQIMYTQPPLQLNAGDSMTSIRIPMPEDSCFALRVFPNETSLLAKPVAVVANCSSPDGNLSLLYSLPANENELATASWCRQVTGSFDPNDKTGYPLGLGDAHYIESGDDLSYTLRFQNTGNDTAFLVVLRDTLPATLDPSTFRPEGASHPYTWEVSGTGVAVFTFANILLPDSTTNEVASQGYVTFRIRQQPGLPDGTLIENKAHIYFDFNEAVITNIAWHTIGRPSVVGTQDMATGSERLKVSVIPHPVADCAQFVLDGELPVGPVLFALYDLTGKIVRETSFEGPYFLFDKKNLPAGLYAWQIYQPNGVLAQGKLVIKQ